MKLRFTLKRPARKAGGDRYEFSSSPESTALDFVIYIPQEISREGGVPKKHIDITFETVAE